MCGCAKEKSSASEIAKRMMQKISPHPNALPTAVRRNDNTGFKLIHYVISIEQGQEMCGCAKEKSSASDVYDCRRFLLTPMRTPIAFVEMTTRVLN